MHGGPDEKRVFYRGIRVFWPSFRLPDPPKALAQKRESVLCAAHHCRMVARIRKGRSEHQPVLQRMHTGVRKVRSPHLRKVIARIVSLWPCVQMAGEGCKGAADDFREDVISVREMF